MIGENMLGVIIFIASVVILVILWVILIYIYVKSKKKSSPKQEKKKASVDNKAKEDAKGLKNITLKEVPLDTLFADKNLATAVAKTLKVPVNQSIKEDALLAVKELNAEYANIENLAGIGKLKNLERLNVSNNAIKELPTEMGGLEKLEKLQVAYNELSAVVPIIKDNKELKSLDISGNAINGLGAEVFSLPKLEEIIAVNSGIPSIPKDIAMAKNLQNLNLSHNDLEELPVELGNLENLKRCNFSYNKIKEIPEEISKLSELEEFDISRNGMTEIPEKVAEQMKTQSILLPTTSEASSEEDNNEGEPDMNKLVNTYIDLTSSNDNLLADLKELENLEQKVAEEMTAEQNSKQVKLPNASVVAPIVGITNEKEAETSPAVETEVTVTFGEATDEIAIAKKKKKKLFVAVGAAVGTAAVVTASVAAILLNSKKGK